MMRRTLRLIGRLVGALLLFALVFPPAWAALSPERLPPLARPLPMPPDAEYRVFVADWGYHTAIVVEQPPGWGLGPPGEEGARFLEYAWGDRRFYLESDFRPHALFATLVLPTEAVLYLDGRPDPPRLGGASAVHARTVDARTLLALLTELERAFVRDSAGGRQTPYAPAAGYPGRFFPAHGRYLWARDCNWWTVQRLAAVGLAGSPAGVIVTAQTPGRLHGFTPVVR